MNHLTGTLYSCRHIQLPQERPKWPKITQEKSFEEYSAYRFAVLIEPFSSSGPRFSVLTNRSSLLPHQASQPQVPQYPPASSARARSQAPSTTKLVFLLIDSVSLPPFFVTNASVSLRLTPAGTLVTTTV